MKQETITIDDLSKISIREQENCFEKPNKMKKGKIEDSVEKELMTIANNTLRHLRDLKKITSQNDVDYIIDNIMVLSEYLPGSLTIQKILGLDNYLINWEDFTDNHYKEILMHLVKLFDQNFPMKENHLQETIKNFFAIENRNFFIASFNCLLNELQKNKINKVYREENNQHKKNALVYLLQSILISPGLFDALIQTGFVFEYRNEIEKGDNEVKMRSLLQNLVSLPNKIANALEGDVPDFFKVKQFFKFILSNILKIIDFFTEAMSNGSVHEITINMEMCALLLSKTCINFNEFKNSEEVEAFVKILLIWTHSDEKNHMFYYKVINEILKHLLPKAIETFSVLILKNAQGKYKINDILNPALISNQNWNYVLCTKIPLLTFYVDEEIHLLRNLVFYLKSSSPESLAMLLLNLLDSWSSNFALHHTTTEQHFYISELIILIVINSENCKCLMEAQNDTEKYILSGMPLHLQSPIDNIRAIGMALSEIILTYLNKNDEKKKDIKLNFEYDSLSVEAQVLVKKLFGLGTFEIGEITFDFKELLRLLTSNMIIGNATYKPPDRKFKKIVRKQDVNTEILVKSLKKPNQSIKIFDSNDFELDSDDDLEAYDITNDVVLPKKSPPAYLRDLRDGLLENQDVETFTLSLQNSLDLITTQLPDDDPSIGLELLEILVSLNSNFYVDNYDELVFQSCVAITCTYPVFYAEYLCKQFHADSGTYSITHRILMLDILKEAAKTLADLKPGEKNLNDSGKDGVSQKIKDNKKVCKSKKEEADEIIRQRLESKTRRFTKHKTLRVEKLNRFSDVAGAFFYPLIYGFGQNSYFNIKAPKNDEDCVLLINFLQTVSVVMAASQNCPIAPKMGKEIFHMVWFLRYHKEAKVRIAVLNLITTVILHIPKSILMTDFMDELIEIRFWLSDVLSPNIIKGDPNSDCRLLGSHVLSLVDSILKIPITDEV